MDVGEARFANFKSADVIVNLMYTECEKMPPYEVVFILSYFFFFIVFLLCTIVQTSC